MEELPAGADSQEIKPIRQDLVDALVSLKKKHGLSDVKLGRRMGSNGSSVNRAINGKFIGDAAAFEAKVEDFLKSLPKRRNHKDSLVENVFSRAMRNFFETVRRTDDMGIAYSPAGKGKTSGCKLFVAENPTSLYIEMTAWSGGGKGIERQIFDTIDTRSWSGNSSRGQFIVERLTGSGRLIIIDNAHRLDDRARKWIFDFHDATGCPIALVGNEDIIANISKNDQQFSRIGLFQEMKGGNAPDDVCMMITQLWPAAVGHVEHLAAQVIKEKGHLRALKKQLLLAKDIAHGFESHEEAFRAAHKLLIRAYELTKEIKD